MAMEELQFYRLFMMIPTKECDFPWQHVSLSEGAFHGDLESSLNCGSPNFSVELIQAKSAVLSFLSFRSSLFSLQVGFTHPYPINLYISLYQFILQFILQFISVYISLYQFILQLITLVTQ